MQLFLEVSHSLHIHILSNIHPRRLAIDHRVFGLVTGAVIPVLVRAETIYANPPPTSIEAAHRAPVCTPNPVVAARV